jgi:hypothetical protein
LPKSLPKPVIHRLASNTPAITPEIDHSLASLTGMTGLTAKSVASLVNAGGSRRPTI